MQYNTKTFLFLDRQLYFYTHLLGRCKSSCGCG